MKHPQKECGGCTACCKIMAITELDKPAHQWCAHCDIGKGCNIYGDRPQSCRDFECVWLQAGPEVLDDSFRPDRVKVVFTASGDKLVAHCDPASSAWRQPKIMEVLWRAANKKGHSIVRSGRRFYVVTPDKEYEAGEDMLVRKPNGEIHVKVPYMNGVPAIELYNELRGSNEGPWQVP